MPSIRRRASGSWQVLIRIAGLKPLSRTFENKSDAARWARQTETQITQGDLSAGLDLLRKTTLASLIERYRDTVTVRKKSASKEKVLIKNLLLRRFTQFNLAALTPQHFADYRDLRARTVASSTINHDLAILNQVYRLAKSEWAIPVNNPLTGLRRPKAAKSRDRRLMRGELEKLVTAAQKCRNKHVLPVIEFAIETAMRRSEILNIQWEHIDLQARTLHIPVTKTGHPRTIPLSPRAVSILTSRSGPSPFPMTIDSFDMAWKRLIERSKLVDLHFHDLRHEAISRLFERGLTMPEVALISGHKDPRMLFRYTHLKPEDVVKKLSEKMEPSPETPSTRGPEATKTPPRRRPNLIKSALPVVVAG